MYIIHTEPSETCMKQPITRYYSRFSYKSCRRATKAAEDVVCCRVLPGLRARGVNAFGSMRVPGDRYSNIGTWLLKYQGHYWGP